MQRKVYNSWLAFPGSNHTSAFATCYLVEIFIQAFGLLPNHISSTVTCLLWISSLFKSTRFQLALRFSLSRWAFCILAGSTEQNSFPNCIFLFPKTTWQTCLSHITEKPKTSILWSRSNIFLDISNFSNFISALEGSLSFLDLFQKNQNCVLCGVFSITLKVLLGIRREVKSRPFWHSGGYQLDHSLSHTSLTVHSMWLWFMPQETHNYVVDSRISKTESETKAVSSECPCIRGRGTGPKAQQHAEMRLIRKRDMELRSTAPHSQKGGDESSEVPCLRVESWALLQTLKERWKWAEGQWIQTPGEGRFQTLQQAGPCPVKVLAPNKAAEYLEKRRHEEQLTPWERDKVLFWTILHYSKNTDTKFEDLM